jgi:hypothetical protein
VAALRSPATTTRGLSSTSPSAPLRVPPITSASPAGWGAYAGTRPSAAPRQRRPRHASPAALGSNPFDTSAAANDAATNCGGSGPDIFFTFTPADTGGYQFSTCNGTGFDSILAVLNSGCAGELACNDDACGLQSTVVANLTAGTTYIVQVDGFGGGFGAGNLEITFLGGGGGNNYTVCDSANAFEDISTTGTLAATISGCDDCTESLPIGFSFDFYGTAFTDVQASSNGLVAFGTPSAVFGNVAIPNAQFNSRCRHLGHEPWSARRHLLPDQRQRGQPHFTVSGRAYPVRAHNQRELPGRPP